MWAIIPFHVGPDSVDVGHRSIRCGRHSGDTGQSMTAPRVVASRSCLTSFLPLLFHPCHLRSERLPVAFWNRRFPHFLDDVGEVLQAGDGVRVPALSMATYLRAHPSMMARVICSMETPRRYMPSASFSSAARSWPERKLEPGTAAHFLDELRLRLRRTAGCLLLQVRPEAIADFEHKL